MQSGLEDRSVDVVVADLPFGLRHARYLQPPLLVLSSRASVLCVFAWPIHIEREDRRPYTSLHLSCNVEDVSLLCGSIDIAKLLAVLANKLRVGGRALVVGNAGSCGTAMACKKAAQQMHPRVWQLRAETACSAGGVSCIALLLECHR